jgi:hypothetical protein
MKKSLKFILILLITTALFQKGYSQKNDTCLFKNPICFYNTDVLTYLQILHKNQQYEKMCDFLYGPLISASSKNNLITKLSNASFGYSLKRVGIINKTKTSWSLTYQRTLLGSNETFKIDCALIDNKCKVYMDEKVWNILFLNKN